MTKIIDEILYQPLEFAGSVYVGTTKRSVNILKNMKLIIVRMRSMNPLQQNVHYTWKKCSFSLPQRPTMQTLQGNYRDLYTYIQTTKPNNKIEEAVEKKCRTIQKQQNDGPSSIAILIKSLQNRLLLLLKKTYTSLLLLISY